jgi:multidrug resistance efflux pump
LAGVFFFLCLWSVRDAWYTSDKTLKKHPHTVAASFETSGTVEKVYVKVGDTISKGQLLAELNLTKKRADFETAKEKYTTAKKAHEKLQDMKPVIKKDVALAKETMDTALKEVEDIQASMQATKLHAPSKGEIITLSATTHSVVTPEEPALVINPKDHFYLFNKSLAIFSFFAFWLFLALHFFAS